MEMSVLKETERQFFSQKLPFLLVHQARVQSASISEEQQRDKVRIGKTEKRKKRKKKTESTRRRPPSAAYARAYCGVMFV